MLIFAIALILLLGGNSECFSPGREHLKEDLLTLNFLGTVEGVSYYVEPNKTMVWKDALKYCEDSGYDLAATRSKIQTDFLGVSLYNTYGNGTVGGTERFWVGAREDRKLTGLVWHNTEDKPDTAAGFHWRSLIGDEHDYLQCSTMSSTIFGSLFLEIFPCSENFYVLCQTTH